MVLKFKAFDSILQSSSSRISCCHSTHLKSQQSQVLAPLSRKVQVKKNTQKVSLCCAYSTLGLKSITVNKQKLNNKHTQRKQEFTWFDKLPTSTATTEKFHYKIGRYNSAQEHSQETQIPIQP